MTSIKTGETTCTYAPVNTITAHRGPLKPDTNTHTFFNFSSHHFTSIFASCRNQNRKQLHVLLAASDSNRVLHTGQLSIASTQA